MDYTANDLKEYTTKNPAIPNHYSGFCFGCVKRNQEGLKLQFWLLDGRIFTTYNIPPKYSGFQGLGHGGIIAALLDEISAWTVYVNTNKLGVTQNFSLNYIKPVYINTDIIIEGVIASNENTHVIVHAHIKNMENKILVEANSTWSLPDHKALSKLFNIKLEEINEVAETYFPPIVKFKENQKSSD
jgi:acyl-coenzyme A thioesterase PaaI-like protein